MSSKITNEKLVALFKSTNNRKNKDLIFRQLKSNLKYGAFDICQFYSNLLKSLSNDFIEEGMQVSDIIMLKCIDKFNPDKKIKFITYYYNSLKHEINKLFVKQLIESDNESKDYLIDTDSDSWNMADEKSDLSILEDKLDLKLPCDKVVKTLNSMVFKKDLHKQLFFEYLGFDKENYNYYPSFNELGIKYGVSRMGVKKIIDRYFKELKDLCEKELSVQKEDEEKCA